MSGVSVVAEVKISGPSTEPCGAESVTLSERVIPFLRIDAYFSN